MSRYRVQYTDQATVQRRSMPAQTRVSVDDGMRRLASDPYGHGSIQAPRSRGKDRRMLTVPNAIVVYWVHDDVLVITAVDIIH
ncbi:type II toxin-antitoxin system RelE/ParE family toxin [Streptomyces sp. NPDC088116]|uniref:type II toxin-antitoxin system RelE family toxin n=1 Tax=Streptomyces sp. NPDC088116 TaxID=3365825 RepID=UPI00380F8543